jgi:hypothetical protein
MALGLSSGSGIAAIKSIPEKGGGKKLFNWTLLSSSASPDPKQNPVQGIRQTFVESWSHL